MCTVGRLVGGLGGRARCGGAGRPLQGEVGYRGGGSRLACAVDDGDVVDVAAVLAGAGRLVVAEIDPVDGAAGERAEVDLDEVPPVGHEVAALALVLRMGAYPVLIDEPRVAKCRPVGE